VYFQLSDNEGEAVFIGDDMVGIKEWEGEVEKTGGYKIRVAMSCLEGELLGGVHGGPTAEEKAHLQLHVGR
jgi:hypothetical protein